MYRRSLVLFTGLAVLLLASGFMTAQDKSVKEVKEAKDIKEDKRKADRAAIEKLTTEMTQAFDKRDAAAIAAHWTEEGEFIRNDGEPISGRAEIQQGYADYFKTLKGKAKLEIEVDDLHFPSADTAVSEVTLRLKDEAGEVVASSWRNTLLVREGGQWKVAVVREWDRDSGYDTNLQELEWLIGTWQANDKEGEVTTVYEWDENKAFIRGKYTVKEGGKVVKSGLQMIGKDNAEGTIRSWVFQSDGGFGGGVWTREGKTWSVDVYGVTSDGSELTATSIYVHVNPNTYTWQGVDQAIDDEPIPDTQPIKVTRQGTAK